MNTTIFITMLFTLQLFYYLIARRASSKVEGEEDYFLAGKNVSLFPLMMTFLATQVGGGVILGSAEEAYQGGWSVLFYPLGSALGLIVLGLGIGRKLAQFKVSTVAQIFEVVYNSPLLKQFASILSIISLFMTLMAQIVASNHFLTSMGLISTPLFILFWVIVILYTVRGGLRALISTDLVQAAFFSIVFLSVGALVWWGHAIPTAESFIFASSKVTRWFLMPLLFILIEQDIGQRCFAGGSKKIISKAALFAGLCMMIVCAIPVYLGVLAKSKGIEIPAGSSVLMGTISALTNPWITSLVGCAVLAAVISTVTSLINAISSNLLNDFIKIKNVSMIRLITFAVAIGAVGLALCFDNIVDLMIFGYELSVCCLFIPIAFALFKNQGNFFAALFAVVFGLTGFFLFRIVPLDLPKEVTTILFSLLGFGIGTLLHNRLLAFTNLLKIK